MPTPKAFTVWIGSGSGRVCTCTTREQAERIRDKIIADPAKWLHIQEWEPGADYKYVTFDGDEVEDER